MHYPDLLTAILNSTIALLIIIDPLAGLPVFLALERDPDPVVRRRTINLIMWVAFLILALAATIGRRLLQLFNVGMPELMVAGGLLLTLIGMDLIFRFLPRRSGDPESLGIVPLACPLLAGPGAIVTVMLMIERNPVPFNYLIAFVSMTIAVGISWVTFYHSEFLIRLLRARGLLILGKLVGILVTAIGVHFVLNGLGAFWQAYQAAP